MANIVYSRILFQSINDFNKVRQFMDNNDFDLNKIINMPEDATNDWARFFWGTKWNTQNTQWFNQSKNPTVSIETAGSSPNQALAVLARNLNISMLMASSIELMPELAMIQIISKNGAISIANVREKSYINDFVFNNQISSSSLNTINDIITQFKKNCE